MAIELRNVTFRVGAETQIYETSLTLKPGGFNILLGTTLSGKTTLMRLMAGLERPTTGEIWTNGENVTRLPVQQRSVAMVYQSFINYPSFTVYENIASPLKVAGFSRQEIDEKVHRFADLLKLTPMLNRLPRELSGGQQQRTALARALVKGAELVLLDEPLANLDYKLREELRDELPKLFEDTGATVVYATTEPLEALMLGGNTATLKEGRVVQFGSTASIYRKPNTLESAEVFSDPPINTAVITKRGDQAMLGEVVSWSVPEKLTALPDGEYKIALRPHHFLPEGDGVKVSGTVQIAEISGSESIIRLKVNGNVWVSQAPGIHSFEYGEKAHIYFNPDHCMYFGTDDHLIDL
ncbi:MAG: ABC transporter ATP-binding protein [Desulfofustis sp. PB-SRB1]|jgi:glycerol transport system ATP-binding protein|nr:ABC transporter ATP-binding protein [Desulfofustis sp. PB-SRB1]MBM1002181.1 ABC transporter ATP-binding protein [Desulfofustis sp. PB-SRB1]